MQTMAPEIEAALIKLHESFEFCPIDFGRLVSTTAKSDVFFYLPLYFHFFKHPCAIDFMGWLGVLESLYHALNFDRPRGCLGSHWSFLPTAYMNTRWSLTSSRCRLCPSISS